MELPIDRLFSPADWRRRTSRERLWEQAAAGVDSHTGVEDRSGRKSREKVHKSLSEANEA